MKIKKMVVKKTTKEIKVNIKEKWSCASCGKFTKINVTIPDDVDTRYPCQFCGNEDGHFIDAEFVSIAWGGALRKLGLEWTGYELEKIEG